ncbi:MAG: prolipoprotein diacylglyceryl transferase [Bacteroidota bacterium]
MHFLSFTWNPTEGIDLGFYTIQYYSLMFVIAFSVGWFIMKSIFKNENEPLEKLDSLFIYMVLAILVGARLGHVIFYQPELFREDFWSIFLPISTKDGFEFTGFRGLASHGATLGSLIAMYFYSKKVSKKSMLWILDRLVIPSAFGAILVRFGNFMNSEIIGKNTTESFVFGVRFIRNKISGYEATKVTGIGDVNEAYKAIETDPKFADLLATVPYSHPAQLYEAVGYVFVFIILLFMYWKTEKRKQLGYLFGLFFVLLFTVRMVAEHFKKSQEGFADGAEAILSTGQWLSIPFILAGLYFMIRSKNKKIE